MGTLLTIIGVLLLLPIALVLVALTVITLVGGYVGLIASMFWKVGLVILAVIIVLKIVKHFFG